MIDTWLRRDTPWCLVDIVIGRLQRGLRSCHNHASCIEVCGDLQMWYHDNGWRGERNMRYFAALAGYEDAESPASVNVLHDMSEVMDAILGVNCWNDNTFMLWFDNHKEHRDRKIIDSCVWRNEPNVAFCAVFVSKVSTMFVNWKMNERFIV